MFSVSAQGVESGMQLLMAIFQVIIALDSFFDEQIFDQKDTSVLLSYATGLVSLGFVTVLVWGRKVINSLDAQPA